MPYIMLYCLSSFLHQRRIEVNRDIKNYPPHINLDRNSLRQFTFETTNYSQVWSVITIRTVTILYTSVCICV